MSEEQKGIKVLHVDDEPDFLALTKAFLEREYANFSIASATSAEEAVELLKSGTYDVVVSDYKMPVMDGLEFLRNLRQSGNTIPFIMFTGKGREEVAIEALNRGASGYLQKGADIKSMYRTLAHAIKQEAETKRAWDELVELKKEQQIVLDSVPTMIFHVGGDSNYIYVNRRFADTFGRKPADFKGKSTKAIFPEEAETYIKSDKEVVKSGVPKIRAINEIITPRGKRWLRTDKVPVKDVEGNVTGIIGFGLDITERKRAEEKVKHLNAVLRAIRSVNQLVVREKDREKLLQSTCDSLIATRGYHNAWIALIDVPGSLVTTAEAGLGKDFLPLVERLKRGELTNCGQKALMQLQVVATKDPPSTCADCPLSDKYHDRGTLTVRLEYGEKVYGLLSASIPKELTADEEEQSLFEEVAGDIGFALYNMELEEERKRAEEALLESEGNFRALAENASDGILIATSGGVHVYANTQAAEITGYTVAELLETNMKDLAHPDELKNLAERLPKRLAGERVPEQYETAIVRKDGEKVPVEITGAQTVWHGQPADIVIVRDITERKKAEETMRVGEEKYKALYDNAPLSYQSLNEDGSFNDVNPAWIRTLGYDRKEVIGKWFGDFLHPDWKPHFEKIFPEFKRCGYVHDVQFKIRHKDGHYLDISFEGYIGYNPDGSFRQTYCVFQDITERKRAEEALRESELQYRDLVDNINDGLYKLNADGYFTFVNKVILDRSGIPEETFYKLRFNDLAIPEDCDMAQDNFDKVMRGEYVPPYELQYRTEKGSRFAVEVSTKSIYKEHKIVGLEGISRDITERKRAEEKLAKIVDGVDIPAFAINSEHKITHWNTAVESLTGLKKEAAIGSDKQGIAFYAKKRPVMADLIIDEAPKSEFKDWYGDKYQKSSLIEGAYEALDFFPSLGEEGKWLLFTAAPLRDSEGTVIGAIETLQDITERKQMEEKHRESEEEYRSLVESTEDSVYLVDRDCRYLFVNNKYLFRFDGLAIDKVIDRFYGEFHSEEETKEFAEKIEEVFETGKPVQYEHKSRRDGRYFIRTLSPVKDSEGRTTAVTVVSKDISERKEAEEEIRKLSQYQESIIDNANIWLDVLDEKANVVIWNKAAEEISGYTHEEVVGHGKIWEWLYPDEAYRKEITEKAAAIILGDAVEDLETTIRRKDGQIRIISWHSRNLTDKKGAPIGSIALGRDITEQKQAEEERESLLKELEAKNRELGKFTYTVSHDLRSPLVTIQGFTDMVQTDLAQNEVEKAKDNLTFIDKAATRMGKLLRETLELSRIGRVTNPPEDVPFGDIVKDALAQTAEQIKSSGVEVSVAEDFPTVHVDRMRIAEVLVNLITNGINYRGEQSHPKIEIGHRIDIGERVFFVQDNGIGIDPGQHEKVFDLFYQVDSGGKGTGAGLAIVKRIIEGLGGRIWIESEKGKGCTICFTLPAQ